MTTVIEYVQHAGGWLAWVLSEESRQRVEFEVDDGLLIEISEWIELLEGRHAAAFAEWVTTKRLEALYKAFIAPLEAYLPPAGQGERLILAPDGPLYQFPLNAARNPETKRYLAQDYLLAFMSDSSALTVYLNQARQLNWQWHQPKHPLHIACSGHPHLDDKECLQTIEESALYMTKLFPNVKVLTEEDATLPAVLRHLPSRDLVHFFCHGRFEPRDSHQSGLLLYDGFLPASRIAYEFDFSQTHLIVLAACRSHHLYMMIENLLIAKAKVVVAALWNANELATQALFQHFYTAIQAGQSSAQALNDAIKKIFQTKKWQHPYYWAAFQNIGLAHGIPTF